jgi:hypothetical protein
MPLSPPIGALISAVRWFSSAATKKLFLQTFHRSHEIWIKHHRLGTYWNKCGDHIEYSLYLAYFTDPEPRASKIAIRAITENIVSLSMTFEAESDTDRFQEQITMHDVNRKAIVWTLANIPYQNFIGIDHSGCPRFMWDKYRLRNVKIQLQCGQDITLFDSVISHLTHTWAMNSRWEFKWGRFWNLDALQWAKHQLMQYWRFRFGMPAIRVYYPSHSSPRNVSWWQVVRAVTTRPIAWLMATEFACSIQFWLLLWSGLFVLNDESELQWRWHNKSIAQ